MPQKNNGILQINNTDEMPAVFLQTKTLLVIAVLIAVGGGVWFFSDREESPYETVVATRGGIVQEVSVTGAVTPAEDVSLSFQRSGTVVDVYADVGDQVVKGEVLVRLQSNDLLAEFNEAQAILDAERAKLDALIRGTRPEEIEIQESTVEQRSETVNEEKQDLKNVLDDASIKADEAVYVQADQLFTNPRGNQPTLDIQASDSQPAADIESRRLSLQATFSTWQGLSDNFSTTTDMHVYADAVTTYLNEIALFLKQLSRAINNLSASSDLSLATINEYKSDVATARADIQTGLSNVTTADENLKTAESNLSLEQQELALLNAGSTEEEIAEQRARVKSAEATVARRQAELSKTVLRAPFTGVVTTQNAKIGQIQKANEPVTELISENRFEIETFIPEADIALVEKGDTATFTLDAYGDGEQFTADVFSVDPAETVIEGVSTYKTILTFEDTQDLVRSGMTANVDILTEQKQDVITIPARAVNIGEGNVRTVRILKEDGTVEMRTVEIGLRGSDGRIEITEGITEGDEVIVFEKQ